MVVTLTEAQLVEATSMDSAHATRLLPVATAVVEAYAPDAPEALQNEAAIRFAGYLYSSGLRRDREGRHWAAGR